jgi:hypothetical protein
VRIRVHVTTFVLFSRRYGVALWLTRLRGDRSRPEVLCMPFVADML